MKGVSEFEVKGKLSASSFTFLSTIWIQIIARDLEESVSEESEAQLSWEEMERGIWERRESILERRGGLVSPAPQCLDKLQQQWAEDSAKMKQDAGSNHHFKDFEKPKIFKSLRWNTPPN